MGEVYAAFIFINVLFGTVVDKRYSAVLPQRAHMLRVSNAEISNCFWSYTAPHCLLNSIGPVLPCL